MKLSKVQQDVIGKMKNGWELGCYSMGGCNLQKGGLGYGGEVQGVNHSTVSSLYKKGLLKQIYGFPATRYILKET